MRRLAWLGAVLALPACYPGGGERVGDFDAVVTQHDRSANFAAIRTYALPDSIREVDVGGVPLAIDHAYDPQILAKVASRFDGLGWQRVDPAAGTPDVDVVVSASAARYASYASYAFYSGWPGWSGFDGYDDGWGVSYPWASYGYGVTDVRVFDAGTVTIEVLDAAHPDPTTKTLRALWSAAVQGLLTGDPSSTLDRLNRGIDQAFAQSTYL